MVRHFTGLKVQVCLTHVAGNKLQNSYFVSLLLSDTLRYIGSRFFSLRTASEWSRCWVQESVVRKLSSGTLPTQTLLMETSAGSLVLPLGLLAVRRISDLLFSFGCGRMSGDPVIDWKKTTLSIQLSWFFTGAPKLNDFALSTALKASAVEKKA